MHLEKLTWIFFFIDEVRPPFFLTDEEIIAQRSKSY